MGKLLSYYKYNLIQEILDNIGSNTSHYYVFGSNPVSYANTIPTLTDDDYSAITEFMSTLMFGKKLANTDIQAMIQKNIWTSNTVYSMYNNHNADLFANNDFYVISEPLEPGATYNIYKCIDNANNSYSTTDPSTIGTPTQSTTFETADMYKWRYIASISSAIYDKFATNDYVPIYANTLIVASANVNAGVEVVMISNSGIGYDAYADGVIQSVVNTTLLQIANSSTTENFKFNNNGIYIYNTNLGTAQLRTVSNYISNSTGKWIYLTSPANTDIVFPSQSEYTISPKVIFYTDGDTDPLAYSVVNTYSNSISSIVILDIGSNITRANVSIQSSFGSGANLYAIVPPPGGHGAYPAGELNLKGMGIAFNFANTESNTIITANAVYNKIGILRNPYNLESDFSKGSRYSANTFNQLLKSTVSPSYTFTIGEKVIGSTSGAEGLVVFANSSTLYLTGDRYFETGEYIGNTTVSNTTVITVTDIGDLFNKDLKPIYINNINNINRSNTQTESFKIVIQL